MLCDADQRTGCRCSVSYTSEDHLKQYKFLLSEFVILCFLPPLWMFAVQDLNALMVRQPSAPLPQGKLVKAIVAGSCLFKAVTVLFKLIKYFQPKHLSMGSIIILTECICLFPSTTKCVGLDNQ